MNRRFLPSISGLTAFESVARHGSITAAASDLNLTQSAVSRQIQQLETLIDVKLFERVRQRVILTDAGKMYLNDVARVLLDLSSATHRTVGCAGNSGNLNLAVFPSFATRWLMPRLPDFLEQNSNVTVNLTVRSPHDYSMDAIDGAIHYSSDWPGAVAYHVMDGVLVPTCSPRFRDDNCVKNPDDLSRVALLHLTTRLWAWPDWFRKHGLKGHASRGARFEQWLMLSQAALHHMGVALLPMFAVEQELLEGKLVQPISHCLTDKAYYLIVPESKVTSPLVQSFRRWLVQKAKVSLPDEHHYR